MRTIKFRGKRLDNKAWVFGSYSDFLIAGENEPQPCIIYTHPDKIGNMIIAVDPKTISQFTGLTDKNGTEIYEGDIILCKEKYIYTVEWICVGFNMRGKSYGGVTSLKSFLRIEKEVIGNIHDNPDLLTDK